MPHAHPQDPPLSRRFPTAAAMPSRLRRAAAALARLAAVLLSLHLSAGAVEAQDPPPCTQDCEDVAPPVFGSFSPAGGTFSQPSISVQVGVSDQYLDTASLVVTFGGADVTSAFAFVPTPSAPTSKGVVRGTIALAATPKLLVVTICDMNGDCPSVSATYAYGVPGVSVSPDAGTGTVAANTTGTRQFTVANTGPSSAVFNMQATCRMAESGTVVAGCSASPASWTIGAAASTPVTVSYPSGAAGGRLSVELRARQANAPGVEDVGWVEVDVHGTGSSQGGMAVSVVDLNSEGTISRGECVTVSAGAGAAYECGDLRLAHGVPGMQVRGRARAPVLLYNSQHAHPRPTVYADVTLPDGTAAPSQVVATVAVTGGPSYTRTFNGADWQPGTTRRIAVQWDGLATAGVHVYPYTLHVTSVYGSTQSITSSVPAREMVVVNGADSPFGAGWWLAGLESLQCPCVTGEQLIHVAGDGSTRVYEPPYAGAVLRVAQHPDHSADTLFKSQGYIRRIRGGGQINFDLSGRHVRTISRLGDTTHFVYDGTTGRLAYVSVPRRDGGQSGFRFAYTGGVLTSVTPEIDGQVLPGITLVPAGARITEISDPDGLVTRFGYGDAQNPNRVTKRTDRAGVETVYAYDGAGKLRAAGLELAAGDSIIQRFHAAEGKGVAVSDGTVAASVALSQAYTLLDGPRTDVADHTRLWLGARGAPRRIRDAAGGETVLNRTDARFPALVTEVRGTSARGDSLVVKARAAYDFRGRVQSSTAVNPLGDGQNATTTYTYIDKWDAAKTITAPGVGVTTILYDTANGNVLWQQQGDSTRRVYMEYNASGPAAGLLARVRYPDPVTGAAGGGGADSIGYDPRGNVLFTRSPLGYLTYTYRDARGRDTLTITPVHRDSSSTEARLRINGARMRTGYDAMGRVNETEAVGRPVALPPSPDGTVGVRTAPGETLRVSTKYDAVGRPVAVRRWSVPDSAMIGVLRDSITYDRGGRKIREQKNGLPADTFAYDYAGNLTVATTARGHQIVMRYDALGRLVRRSVPAVTENQACPPTWFSCTGMQFPYYPSNAQGGFTAPAEEFVYRYDAAGNQVRAENLDAIVSRTYFPNGALKTDTIRMRSYGGWTTRSTCTGWSTAMTPSGGCAPCSIPWPLRPRCRRTALRTTPSPAR